MLTVGVQTFAEQLPKTNEWMVVFESNTCVSAREIPQALELRFSRF